MSTRNHFKLKQAAIRMVSAPPLKASEPMNSPEAAIRVMASELKDYDREVVCVVNLKASLEPINFSIASMGVLDQSIVHPREMMKSIILSNAAKIMIIHNHPSGKLNPSKEDIEVTDRMQQACSLIGVQVLDHIIIGGGNDRQYYSFHENSVMPTGAVRYAKEMSDIKWDMPVAAEGSNPYHRESVRNKLNSKKQEAAKQNKKAPDRSKNLDPEL